MKEVKILREIDLILFLVKKTLLRIKDQKVKVHYMKRGGFFIVLEGGVGSGKSTQVDKFKKTYPEWIFVREPGSTVFGEKIREAVQGLHNNYHVDPYAALLAYSSARANLVRFVIIPELKKGKTVLLDRYWYSTVAYQGEEGIPVSTIISISKIATDDLVPDIVLHYDLLPEIGMERKKEDESTDKYDLKPYKFHQGVRLKYLKIAKRYFGIWNIIDASKLPEEVFVKSREILKNKGIIDR